MAFRARYALILVVSVALAGCRQADGPVPAVDANKQAELRDVSRDLQNLAAARDPNAPEDLAHDLRKYVDEDRPSAIPAVDELSLRTARALAGTKLTEQAAQRLAHDLWTSVEAREMSERQVESLQNNVQSLLMSVGVAEENAEAVAAQVGEVQRQVTARQRRWYEWF